MRWLGGPLAAKALPAVRAAEGAPSPRILALAASLIVALCAMPSAQAWDTTILDADYQGPLDEYVPDDVCVPGVGVSGDFPFVVVNDNCFGGANSPPPSLSDNSTSSSPQGSDNSTGGP